MKIRATVSLIGYDHKLRDYEYRNAEYEVREFELESSPSEIADLIKGGHSFVGIFHTKSKVFRSAGNLNKASFRGTHIMYFDFDDVDFSFEDIISNLKYTPSVAYTTFSHSEQKGKKRYRIFYIFQDFIKGENEYRQVYRVLENQLLKDVVLFDKDFDTTTLDKHMEVSTQCSLGSKSDCKIFYSASFYQKKDFLKQYLDLDDMDLSFKGNAKQTKCRKAKGLTKVNDVKTKKASVKNKAKSYWQQAFDMKDIYNKYFLSDFRFACLNKEDSKEVLLKRYSSQYPLVYMDDIEYRDGFSILDKNFIKIERKWARDTITNVSYIKKIKQGKRRDYLFTMALLFLKMKTRKTITFDYLLFLVLNEAYRYCDKQETITLNEVFRVVFDAYERNISGNNHIESSNKKRFMVDKSFCKAYNISPKSFAAKVKGELTKEGIRKHYDPRKSAEENIAFINKQGVKCCKSTFYKYSKQFLISA